MRCRECDYPLWNLKARECPECGASFRPSDYEFVAETVRFCCPYCRQDYYGQPPIGHLEPRAFSCVGCGADLEMDQMVLLPREGLTEADTRPGVVPWLERRKRGTLKAFLATMGMAMIRPGKLMRGVPRDAPAGDALAFGVLALTPAVVIGGSLPYVGYWAWRVLIGGAWGADFWAVFWFLFLSVVGVFVVAGAIPLMALVAHAVLRLGGRPQHTVDRTIQAVGYSAGAGAVSAVPCVGPFVGWIWWLVSAAIMVRAGQRVSGGRSSTAVLILPVMVLLAISGLAGLLSWWSSSMFGGGGVMAGQGWTPESQQTFALNNSLLQYSWQQNRSGPDHAIELVLVGSLGVWQGTPGAPFCQVGTKTTPADIPVGDGTLQDFLAMGMSGKLGATKTLLESRPEGIIAHRVGDFVFTYHGATLGGNDSNFWTVVMVPDPGVNGTPALEDPVQIGTDRYMVTEITYGELAQSLQEQNAYRKTLGLAPLPDLTTVTHEQPAVAPAASGAPNSQDDP
ncbi:MAG: hypothetical protein ACYTEY_06705 [Planctomycetota bacterium]|jgi:hypothetical protein